MYIHKHVTASNLKLEPYPFMREIAMEAYLVENEEVLILGEGFESVEIVDCEVAIQDAGVKAGTDGRIDVVLKYSPDYMDIAELQLSTLNHDHVNQLSNYLDKRTDLMNVIYQRYPDVITQDNNSEVQWQPQWIGVLVGTGIDARLAEEISKGLYHDSVPIAALVINRYRGKDNVVYVVTDTYFTNIVKGRDYTKYLYKGKCYGKGRLVHAVVRDYVLNNPGVKYGQLIQEFPDHLQGGPMGVVTNDIKAAQAYKGRRFYTEQSELIVLSDGTECAVSNQWGKNTARFITHCANVLGLQIDTCDSGKVVEASHGGQYE
jgi:hypothetical protein